MMGFRRPRAAWPDLRSGACVCRRRSEVAEIWGRRARVSMAASAKILHSQPPASVPTLSPRQVLASHATWASERTIATAAQATDSEPSSPRSLRLGSCRRPTLYENRLSDSRLRVAVVVAPLPNFVSMSVQAQRAANLQDHTADIAAEFAVAHQGHAALEPPHQS